MLRLRTLPLLLLLLAPACASDDGAEPDSNDAADPEVAPVPDGTVGTLRVHTPDGPMTIPYVVQGGRAIHEGDIDLGSAADLQRLRGGAANLGDRWPSGNVYWRFASSFTGQVCGSAMTNCQNVRTKVRTVIDAMEAKLPLNFIEDTGQTADNYITIDWAPADSSFAGVANNVGMAGGEQTIKFRSGHLNDTMNPNWFQNYNMQPSSGTLRHEMLHAVGLWHEQSRPDRDSFITVNNSCIIDDKESQFAIKSGATAVGPYDFNSIMHYGATSFCVAWPDVLGPDPDGDGCVCRPMTPTVAGATIGGGSRPAGFSIEDTNTLYRMYARDYATSSASDHYGKAMAIGDFDGDGYDDLAVGLPDEERLTGMFPNFVTVTNAGAVLLYKGTSNGPVEWTVLSEGNYSGDYTTNGHFGASLAVLDIDADGIDDLAVGAPGTNGNAGAVFTFLGNQSEKPAAHRMLTQSLGGYTDEAGDRFGEALAAGPVTGLSRTDSCNAGFSGNPYHALVVGAPGDRNAGLLGGSSRGGAAYIFQEFVPSCSSAVLTATTRLAHGFSHAAATGDDFGAAVAVGDLDADGKADVAVGAPSRSSDTGTVYTYKGKLPPESSPLFWSSMVDAVGTLVGGTGNQFGTALAIGNVLSTHGGAELVVGAPGNNGRAYVMNGGLSPVNVKTLEDTTLEAGDRFGAALAIGNVDRTDSNLDLVVGIPGEDSSAGAIAVIRGGLMTTRTTLRQSDLLFMFDNDPNDQFGASLAIGHLDGRGPVSSTAAAGSLMLDLAVGAPGEAPETVFPLEGPAGAGGVTLLRGASLTVPAVWKQISQDFLGKL
ncbi:MAG: FG-GAP repeat protein [Myxococcales bacterium]|nr:FG-GAP repeat protein [Myxococcales bacterium]